MNAHNPGRSSTTRRERLDRARDDLERARFERVVGIDTHRIGTLRLGFPPAHAARHADGPGFGRRGAHELARADPLAHENRHRAQRRIAPAPRPPASRGTTRNTYASSRPRVPATLRLDMDVQVARLEQTVPASSPRHELGPVCTRTAASTGHAPNATNTAPRSRARATKRRASPSRT